MGEAATVGDIWIVISLGTGCFQNVMVVGKTGVMK